jgi:hypothetical protein
MLFTPPHSGWFDWILQGEARGGHVVVRCSNAFGPVENIIDWMRAIAALQFPCHCKVNEEGCYAVFSAVPVTDRPERIELKIVREDDDRPDQFLHSFFI